ncbi:hypothetical protein [Streptomyces sp. NBC_01451]|uniref:hypothetical protein n=1 Tax=Streptomyces sp. NBC_01451 TaxID=2903872 RepID=UPI002E3738CF|nr:hypothetical protein [Streptomyces sp. NBC_01451]
MRTHVHGNGWGLLRGQGAAQRVQARVADTIDVLGVGAPLTYDIKDDDPHSQTYEKVDNWQKWFDVMWDLLAK